MSLQEISKSVMEEGQAERGTWKAKLGVGIAEAKEPIGVSADTDRRNLMTILNIPRGFVQVGRKHRPSC